MLNIVIPMAGHGSRFKDAGYTTPKPFIPIHGKPMIELVIDNLTPQRQHRFIFICQQQHLDEYQLAERLQEYAPGCMIIALTEITDGAARTVLTAEHRINNHEPLMIANCDQWIDIDINDYLALHDQADLDGFIMTMKAHDPKWSFVRFNEHGVVTEVVEKKVVSDEATVGIYNFKYGADFVSAAKQMISKNLRVNGEFYVAPVYNEMLAEKANIAVYNIGADLSGMYGLGTPRDLDTFISLDISKQTGLPHRTERSSQ
jgi:NDP-sugar pyrophosphorylase family protein